MGAGASTLITGHTSINEQLEAELAELVGMPQALHFSTGYMANLGIIPALVGPGDTVFSDRLNHACIIDGARLSGAQFRVYAHGDVAQFGRLLAKNTRPHPLIVTDGVFSMDGDIAPLPKLLALSEKYDAWLLVDDAHGFGVLGPQGRGSLAHFGLASPRVLCGGYLPLSLVMTRDAIFDAFYDADIRRGFLHSHSYTGNPLACRAALTTLAIFEEDDVLNANRRRAQRLTAALQPLAGHERDRNFRQCGMIWPSTSKSTILPLPPPSHDASSPGPWKTNFWCGPSASPSI